MKIGLVSLMLLMLGSLLLTSCKKPQISEHIIGDPWSCTQKMLGSTVTTTVQFNNDRTGTFGPESALGSFVWDAPTNPNVEIYFVFDNDELQVRQRFHAVENEEESMKLEGSIYGGGSSYIDVELLLTR